MSKIFEVMATFAGSEETKEIYSIFAHDEQEAKNVAIERTSSKLHSSYVKRLPENHYKVAVYLNDPWFDTTYVVHAQDEQCARLAAERQAVRDIEAKIQYNNNTDEN